jgi:hypothetical protein
MSNLEQTVRAITLAFFISCLVTPLQLSAQLDDRDSLSESSGDSQVATDEQAALRQVEGHLAFLASDAMGGRDTATVQGAITAQYMASQLYALGLEPAGDDGSFQQTYPLVVSGLDMSGLRFDVLADEERRESFVPEDDYAVSGFGGAGCEVDAPVVFAGHGLVHEASGVDDYAGLDVEGKFVMVLSGTPQGDENIPGLSSASRGRAKRRQASARGAAGLITIVLPDDVRANTTFRYSKARMGGESMGLPSGEDETQPFPRVYVQHAAAEKIFKAAGRDLTEAAGQWSPDPGASSFLLEGIRLALDVPVYTQELTSENTVALLRGSDAELADEMIVISAHMDHVGVGDDGSIFNGADDNATGTTGLLMVAQALAKNRSSLGRSVVILAVSGEEKGLLGSEWWVANPTVDIDKVVANINIDMIGRNQPDSIGVTPSPEHSEHNTLVSKSLLLGPAAGLEVEWTAGEGEFKRRVDEYYYRSDHVNFSKAGIPVVFFFAGEHEDYHKPTDTVEKIDAQKVLRVSNLVALLAQAVSRDSERPTRFSKSEGSESR